MRASAVDARVFLPPLHTWSASGGPLTIHPTNGIQSPIPTNGYPRSPVFLIPQGATHLRWILGPNVGDGVAAGYTAGVFFNAAGAQIGGGLDVSTARAIPAGAARMYLVTVAGSTDSRWLRHGGYLEWTFPT